MATDDTGELFDRQAAFEAVVAALQERHGGVHAPDIAREIFRHATAGTEFVALTDDGETAICYDVDARVLQAIPIDRRGLDLDGATRPWGRLSDPTTWVDAAGADDLAWVHPRYRWVLESTASTWWHTSPHPRTSP